MRVRAWVVLAVGLAAGAVLAEARAGALGDFAAGRGARVTAQVAADDADDSGPPPEHRGQSALRGLLAMVFVVVGIAGFAHVLEKKLRREAQDARAARDAARTGPLGRIPPPPHVPPRREEPPVAAMPARRTRD